MIAIADNFFIGKILNSKQIVNSFKKIRHEEHTNHIVDIDCPGDDYYRDNCKLTASGIDWNWFHHHWLPAISKAKK